MIHKRRTLGLALVAALAASAAIASAASADDLTSEKAPVTITGKQTGGGDVFTFTAGTAKCKEVSYTATTVVTPTTSLTTTPKYPFVTASGEQNCTAFGFPAEIDPEKCTFQYTIGAATTGSLDINCPAGQSITITAESGGTTKCVVYIGPQSGLGTITYSNTGPGTTRELQVTTNLASNLSYSHNGKPSTGTGIGACTSGIATNGSYVGAAIFTGESSGTHVGIFLS